MKWKRKRRRTESATPAPPGEDLPVGYNPHRDETLFWHTAEGYIIAHDIVCQQEYVEATKCPHCGGELIMIAQLNRAYQGLNELIALCAVCRSRATFIFDISNDVYQAWWAAQLGEAYVRQYDGPPREPVAPPD